MKCMGTTWPFESLRCPVSIGCSIRMRTSATSPWSVARIFIGSAMMPSSPRCAYRSATAADSDLHFLRGGEILSVRLDHRPHVGGLAHLDAGRNVALASPRNVERCRQRKRVLLGDERDLLGFG